LRRTYLVPKIGHEENQTEKKPDQSIVVNATGDL
jgi:hypothetical protein